MFDQIKAMGALAGLMKDRGRMEQIARRLKETLEEVRGYGEAGGGAVRVEASGRMRIVRVELSPALASSGGGGMGERLIEEAVNAALSDAEARAREAVEREMRDLDLPGGDALLGSIGGLLAR